LEEERHASYLWQVLRPDIQIQDPDGWDRTNLEWSWYQQQITESEYKERLSVSTVGIPEMTPQAQSLLGYTKSPTTAYDYIEDRNGQESTTKEQKKVNTFYVTFTAEKTVRQELRAEVILSDELIRQATQYEIRHHEIREDQLDIEINGSIASVSVKIEVDLEDAVRDAFDAGLYEGLEVVDACLEESDDFDDNTVEDFEISDR
tara:strand:- start:47 stop:658 length:612 start_codon:yes stop_codon:yes gene_type:complete